MNVSNKTADALYHTIKRFTYKSLALFTTNVPFFSALSSLLFHFLSLPHCLFYLFFCLSFLFLSFLCCFSFFSRSLPVFSVSRSFSLFISLFFLSFFLFFLSLSLFIFFTLVSLFHYFFNSLFLSSSLSVYNLEARNCPCFLFLALLCFFTYLVSHNTLHSNPLNREKHTTLTFLTQFFLIPLF